MAEPYRSTPEFDEATLPAALRKEHCTKAGTWGLIRVIEGRLHLHFLDPSLDKILVPGDTGVILPEQIHFVEPLGPMRMQIHFYDEMPGM